MLVIIGKTASGKDTIVKELCEKYNFKKIVTYTTRPIRCGEINGLTYNFVTEKEFFENVDSGFFLEYKQYSTVHGVWFYGSAKEDFKNADENTVVILTPQGYRDLLNSGISENFKSVYIYADNATIKDRLMLRGDDLLEANRRVEHDNIDFEGIGTLADKTVYNNKGANIEDVVQSVLEVMQ